MSLFLSCRGRRDKEARQGFRAAGLHRSSQSSVISIQPNWIVVRIPWICMAEDTLPGPFDYAPMICIKEKVRWRFAQGDRSKLYATRANMREGLKTAKTLAIFA